jgi:hypothetical protein
LFTLLFAVVSAVVAKAEASAKEDSRLPGFHFSAVMSKILRTDLTVRPPAGEKNAATPVGATVALKYN